MGEAVPARGGNSPGDVGGGVSGHLGEGGPGGGRDEAEEPDGQDDSPGLSCRGPG